MTSSLTTKTTVTIRCGAPLNQALTDETRRWTVFAPIRHHDDDLSDTSSRRVSAFPRLGSRTRSTSEEDDLNVRGSRPGNGLTKKFSDIFGKKSSEVPPGGVETRPMRPTSLALNPLRGKESFSSYDESRVQSSQTRKDPYMKKKKSRASSMLMSVMKKGSARPTYGKSRVRK
ncbi:uncharacterized protein LOC112570923 [Pomacea canaliculata]|uniref:uncharacterized protein LOC112570923 n=1 Tax=Pomacea canaliculata TaxID=400727 RepID=UPI000D732EE4|nr:uncharacterized protein LOC112570923 [Pomacea canaliculata]